LEIRVYWPLFLVPQTTEHILAAITPHIAVSQSAASEAVLADDLVFCSTDGIPMAVLWPLGLAITPTSKYNGDCALEGSVDG
jgi:hypothetical protein